MGWLGSEGVAPITGSRWSAGAFWAEAVDSYRTKVLALTPSSHWGLGQTTSTMTDAMGVIHASVNGATRGVAGAVTPDDLAASFDGVDDRITFANNYILAGSTNAFTILAWVKWATNGNTNTVICKHGSSGGWRLNIASGNLIGIISNSNNTVHDTATASSAITAGVWHHVAFVVSATNLRLYVDGVQVASVARTVTIVGNTDNGAMGRRGAFNADYYEGVLDEVSIFDGTALTGGQIAALLAVPEGSVWEDEDDWPKTDDVLTINAFIGGWPVHQHAQGASWSLGQDDLHAAPSVGSASITLRPEAGVPDPGERVVIVTEGSVLWYGSVESAGETETGDDVTITVACADDLSKAALADWSRRIGGTASPALLTLMSYAGLNPVLDVVHHLGDPIDHYELEEMVRTGNVLAFIGEVAESVNCAAALTPTGLRLYKRTYRSLSDGPDIDALASTRTLTRDRKDVRNIWTFGLATTANLDDLDSAEQYGRRLIHADLGWRIFLFATQLYAETAAALSQPVPRLTYDLPVDAVALPLLPFDVIGEDPHRFLITSLSHSVSVDDWRIGLTAVAVTT